jgi:hypothetical protein
MSAEDAVARSLIKNRAARTRNEWLSPNEVAVALGLHVNTVKRIPPEELPYFRVTSRGDRKYRIEDIEGYIEGRMVYTSHRDGER